MRSALAERGFAGATFEHVAAEAGVSRGLLHYYFGTKERLLVEVVRRDTEFRVQRLDAPLAEAKTVEDVLDVLVGNLLDLIENEPSFFVVIFELFAAGRRNPDIETEVAGLFRRVREHVAAILEEKDRQGAISLRFGAEPTVALLFAIADGVALQAITESDRDHSDIIAAGREAARHILMA